MTEGSKFTVDRENYRQVRRWHLTEILRDGKEIALGHYPTKALAKQAAIDLLKEGERAIFQDDSNVLPVAKSL